MELLDGLDDKPAMRRQLNHFLGWCVERDLIPIHPLRDLKPPKPIAPRESVLTDPEIANLFEQTSVMATIAKLCLLTA